MPVRSRRSMNTSPPWSRRRCTQPASADVGVDAVASTWPHHASRYHWPAGPGTLALGTRPHEPAPRERRASTALLAALHVAHGGGAVIVEDHGAARPEPVRLLHLPLQRAPGEVELGSQARPAQLAHEREGAPRLRLRRGDEDVGGRLGCGLVEREQDPLDPGRPAAAGRGRPAEQLDETVVAPAAGDRSRLRVERARIRTRTPCACSSRARGPASRPARSRRPD